MTLLMIGCGKMGGALLARWASLSAHTITIVDPSIQKSLAGVSFKREIADLSDARFDIIVIAIKPQLIETVLPAYRSHLAESGCIISIAAGYSVSSIEKHIGKLPIMRVMPNLPAQIGRGVSALYANSKCSQAHIALAHALTDAVGYTLLVDSEDELDRVTAVAGSGPGYVFEIARCWIEAAEKLGFSSKKARELVLNTLMGSIELGLKSDQSMTELRNSVTSKHGTTEAGLKALTKDSKLEELFDSTLKAAYQRAIELR